MDKRTDNLPFLQDFVPYRGRCPKRERENSSTDTNYKHRENPSSKPIEKNALNDQTDILQISSQWEEDAE